MAAELGDVEIVEELLKKNADINLENYGGYTPVHTAVEVLTDF